MSAFTATASKQPYLVTLAASASSVIGACAGYLGAISAEISSIPLFVALILFGLAAGLICTGMGVAKYSEEPQWSLLLQGQSIAAVAFMLALVSLF